MRSLRGLATALDRAVRARRARRRRRRRGPVQPGQPARRLVDGGVSSTSQRAPRRRRQRRRPLSGLHVLVALVIARRVHHLAVPPRQERRGARRPRRPRAGLGHRRVVRPGRQLRPARLQMSRAASGSDLVVAVQQGRARRAPGSSSRGRSLLALGAAGPGRRSGALRPGRRRGQHHHRVRRRTSKDAASGDRTAGVGYVVFVGAAVLGARDGAQPAAKQTAAYAAIAAARRPSRVPGAPTPPTPPPGPRPRRPGRPGRRARSRAAAARPVGSPPPRRRPPAPPAAPPAAAAPRSESAAAAAAAPIPPPPPPRPGAGHPAAAGAPTPPE